MRAPTAGGGSKAAANTIALVTLPRGRRRPPDPFLRGWKNPRPKERPCNRTDGGPCRPACHGGHAESNCQVITEKHGDRDGKAGEETSACNGQQFRNRRRR